MLRTAIVLFLLSLAGAAGGQEFLAGPDGKDDPTIEMLSSIEPMPGTVLQIDSEFPVDAALEVASVSVPAEAFAQGFRGEIVVSLGRFSLLAAVDPELAEAGFHSMGRDPLMWPLASVTKQALAWDLVRELDRAGLTLDEPVGAFLPGRSAELSGLTLRDLLRHRSGLRNPDDTPVGEDGWPEFYTSPQDYGLDWCLEGRSAPPQDGWSYNNCDYIVLGAVFDELAYAPVEYFLESGIYSCPEGEECRDVVTSAFVTRENASMFYAMRSPEREALPGYGSAGALGSTLTNVAFENDFMMSRYPNATGAEKAFWQGDPALGYMALGHWVFPVEIEGCDAPVLVSQRKGEIGRYRVENIMLPQLRRSMVFATAEPGFEFGEIWAKQGFLYEAVARLACPMEAAT